MDFDRMNIGGSETRSLFLRFQGKLVQEIFENKKGGDMRVLFLCLLISLMFCLAASAFAEDNTGYGNNQGYNQNQYNDQLQQRDREYLDSVQRNNAYQMHEEAERQRDLNRSATGSGGAWDDISRSTERTYREMR